MIIVDSSFLVAYKNRRDAHHEAAVASMPRVVAMGPMLLHEYAFVETVTVLAARGGPALAVETGAELLDSSEVELVPSTPGFDAAWQRFRTQPSPRYSLADAAMLALAEQRGVGHIASFDRDFRAARGLVVVPQEG